MHMVRPNSNRRSYYLTRRESCSGRIYDHQTFLSASNEIAPVAMMIPCFGWVDMLVTAILMESRATTLLGRFLHNQVPLVLC